MVFLLRYLFPAGKVTNGSHQENISGKTAKKCIRNQGCKKIGQAEFARKRQNLPENRIKNMLEKGRSNWDIKH
jgi:hypothetical protein